MSLTEIFLKSLSVISSNQAVLLTFSGSCGILRSSSVIPYFLLTILFKNKIYQFRLILNTKANKWCLSHKASESLLIEIYQQLNYNNMCSKVNDCTIIKRWAIMKEQRYFQSGDSFYCVSREDH